MVEKVRLPASQSPTPVLDWEPQPPTDLVYDDGEPLESNRHRIAMNVLIDSVLKALQDRSDFFAGGNMFVYYSINQAMNRDFRGPDFFVALDVEGSRDRKAWIVWEEGGRYPDVIVELLSASTETMDRGEKKTLYERVFKTSHYFIFDPFAPNSLMGWHLDASQQYQPLQPSDRGWLWCEPLGLWLGTWEGQLRREPAIGTCPWLRFYDRDGNLVPLQEEVAAAERQRADAAQQQAEAAQQQAEAAQQQAETERQRAEQIEAQLQQTVWNLLQTGMDIAQVANLTGITELQVQQLADRRQISP